MQRVKIACASEWLFRWSKNNKTTFRSVHLLKVLIALSSEVPRGNWTCVVQLLFKGGPYQYFYRKLIATCDFPERWHVALCMFFLCTLTGLDKPKNQRKMLIISYPSVLTYILGAQMNRLIETVLLSTHNICFG